MFTQTMLKRWSLNKCLVKLNNQHSENVTDTFTHKHYFTAYIQQHVVCAKYLIKSIGF